jgi:hypothetical protein
MPVEALATHFRYVVLRGNEVLDDCVHVKARCDDSYIFFQLMLSKGLVLADLIKNANKLFDEPPPDVAETTPVFNFSSFSSPEFPQPTFAQDVNPFARNLSTSSAFSFSPSLSDPYVERHPNVTPTSSFGSFLSPEFPRSAQAVDSTTQHSSTSTGFSFSSSPFGPPVEGSPDVPQPMPASIFSSSLGPGFPRRAEAQGVDPTSRGASQSTGFSFSSSPFGPPVEGSPDVPQPTPASIFSSSLGPGFPRLGEAQGVDLTSWGASQSTGFSFSTSSSDPHVERRSPNVAETTPALPFGWFVSPELRFPRSNLAQAADSTTPHPSMSTRFSFSSSPLVPPVEGSPGVPQPTPASTFRSSLGSGFSRPAEAQGVDPTSQRASQSTGFSFPSSTPDTHVEWSPGVAQSTSTSTFNLFSNPELLRSAQAQGTDSTSRRPYGSTELSFSSLLSDPRVEGPSPSVAQSTPNSTSNSFLGSGGFRQFVEARARERAADPSTSQHPSRSNLFAFPSSTSDSHVERHPPLTDAALKEDLRRRNP